MPGAGSFWIAAYDHLTEYSKLAAGTTKLGVEIMARAMLIVPRTLAVNSGLDPQLTLAKLRVYPTL